MKTNVQHFLAFVVPPLPIVLISLRCIAGYLALSGLLNNECAQIACSFAGIWLKPKKKFISILPLKPTTMIDRNVGWFEKLSLSSSQ